MARQRKPTKTLEASGAFAHNPDRGRAREQEPQYPSGVPAPPPYLNQAALDEYDRLATLLGHRGVLQQTDWGVLVAYCQHWAGMVACWEAGGFVAPANSAEYRRLAAALGLTPADRSKVPAAPVKQTESKWAKVLAMPSGQSATQTGP